jgi:hypothetical protein
MSLEFNALTEILNKIGNELTNQISLAKNIDHKIDTRKLSWQSNVLNNRILESKIPKEDKSSLQKFSASLVQDNTSIKSLRYEKQDLERVLSNLSNL